MQNKTFIELRKNKKYSQARLAEEMYVPITTIRNWERKRSIPSLDAMKQLAKLLAVPEEVIVSIFEPEKTKVEKENEEESRMYNLLLELFWGCDTAEHFLQFTYLFSIGQTSGVVSCYDYVFPFTKVITDQDGTATVLADSSNNYIVLTITNIIEVKPISIDYDIYTFDIDINCPMFPTDLKYSPNSFRQRIRISYFNR